MELRHLRYFVAVAEELHFRRAAERLHVAQPGVSEQIRKLEDELGVRLLERTQRGVSLTVPGAAMLVEARRVLQQAEIAQQAARGAHDHATTSLRIGYLPDSLPASVFRGLHLLAADAPRVRTELEAGSSLRLIEAVRDKRLDAAVVALPAPTRGLQVTSLGGQRAVAAMPVMHANAVDASLSLERLAPERIVVLPHETNPAFHNAVISICRDAGLAPTFVEAAEPSVEHALLAVASGAGLALLPESVVDRFAAPGIRFLPLDDPRPAFEGAVVSRPDTESLATLAFLRAVSRARGRSVVATPRSAVSLAA
jgi:DNA-binding transcriptional LysR family regulator